MRIKKKIGICLQSKTQNKSKAKYPDASQEYWQKSIRFKIERILKKVYFQYAKKKRKKKDRYIK